MSIREQILQWCKNKGLQFVDVVGYTWCVSDGIDYQEYHKEPLTIKVRECRKFTYIYLPMPFNTPYKHRYQLKIENGCAYLLKYLF